MTGLRVLIAGTALIAWPALAQQTPAPKNASTAAPSTTPSTNVAPGAQVMDTSGAVVGTVDSVANGVAIISTATGKIGMSTSSFAQGPKGLLVGISKTDLEAKAAAASAPPQFLVGAQVSGPGGAAIGTIKEVNGDLVTVASETASAQLPKSAFAKAPDGGLLIGMTPEQFDSAAKAAGGAAPNGA